MEDQQKRGRLVLTPSHCVPVTQQSGRRSRFLRREQRRSETHGTLKWVLQQSGSGSPGQVDNPGGGGVTLTALGSRSKIISDSIQPTADKQVVHKHTVQVNIQVWVFLEPGW